MSKTLSLSLGPRNAGAPQHGESPKFSEVKESNERSDLGLGVSSVEEQVRLLPENGMRHFRATAAVLSSTLSN